MGRLTAEMHIESDGIGAIMEQLRAEHSALEADSGVEGLLSFRTHYGSVETVLGECSASIRVFAEDETCLAWMKMTVAGHLAGHLGTAEGIRWRGAGIDAGLPAIFRELTVVSTKRIAPHLLRVRFAADNLARFARGGLHVRLLLPPRGRAPVWPTLGDAGLLVWLSGEDALTVRVYTIRAIDVAAGTVDIDFVLHEGGDTPAATFAATARPGAVVGMIGPGGGDVPDAANLLLAGDDTALPAIARILESVDPSTRVQVFLEVDGPADEIALPHGEEARVTWLHREGREPGTTGLLSTALRQLDPTAFAPDLCVWAGCEYADFRAIRTLTREQWELPKDRHLVVSYWRRGVAG